MQHKTDTHEVPNQPPDDDLLKQPDVTWHKGEDNSEGWSFKPLIRVKPGTDLLEMLDRIRRGARATE